MLLSIYLNQLHFQMRYGKGFDLKIWLTEVGLPRAEILDPHQTPTVSLIVVFTK